MTQTIDSTYGQALLEMTDTQMQLLLSQAAERLQTQQQLMTSQTNDKTLSIKFPRLDTGEMARPYFVASESGVAQMDGSKLNPQAVDKSIHGIRKVEDPVVVRKRMAEQKKATLGTKWYDLPRTLLTDELKRDLQLLKMRNVLDPHRHYKKDNGKMKAPEYSTIGTIVEGPTEYFSARLQNKDRKKTLVEEVLAGESRTGRFSRKYDEIQTKKTSGKKGFYKALKAQRAVSHKKR